MLAYLLRRLLGMIPILFVLSVVSFSLMLLLPGDPAVAMLGETADHQAVQALRQELGLDQPIYVQYSSWLTRALQGDLGRSLRTRQPITAAILQRLPVTLQLTVASLLLALVVSLPIGIVSAVRRNSAIDTVGTVVALLGACIPSFWLGIMLIMLFSLTLHWLPPSGFVGFFDDPLGSVRLTVMPAVCLASFTTAMCMRQARAAMLEVLAQDYVVTARAKGLQEHRIMLVHVLRNALIPVVTVIGLQGSRLFGGAVVVETLFSVPGIGRLIVDSIYARDFPMVQGVLLVMAVVVLLSNLAVDVLYAYIDPRIRYV